MFYIQLKYIQNITLTVVRVGIIGNINCFLKVLFGFDLKTFDSIFFGVIILLKLFCMSVIISNLRNAFSPVFSLLLTGKVFVKDYSKSIFETAFDVVIMYFTNFKQGFWCC